jgi:hypothetical protein
MYSKYEKFWSFFGFKKITEDEARIVYNDSTWYTYGHHVEFFSTNSNIIAKLMTNLQEALIKDHNNAKDKQLNVDAFLVKGFK